MSSIASAVTGGLLGGRGATQGTGWQADRADLQTPTTSEQAKQQYANAQLGLGNQLNFLENVQNQQGLRNQMDVYNQLQGVANGTGANPAQAMLNNATGANVASQAALMASQRGAGMNPALIARQAAMQGAGIQQSAAGQAAALQANQSLNALGQMQGLATNQANQQANATNAYTNAAQNEQGQVLGAINGQNQSNVGSMSSTNAGNAAINNTIAGQQGKFLGNIMGGISSAFAAAEGGQVPERHMFAFGSETPLDVSQGATSGPQSALGKFMAGATSPTESIGASANNNNEALGDGAAKLGKGLVSLGSQYLSASAAAFARGGKVPALVSPGEQYLPPADVQKAKKGENPLRLGERIPGVPKVAGNSYANDTVPKTLESGGIVIPNSVMQSKNPKKKAAEFVAAVLKQQALKGK